MSISVKRMKRFLKARMFKLSYWTNEEILALKMDVDELADYFGVTRETIILHARKRKINIPKQEDVDRAYLVKQVEYLYFKQLMTFTEIMDNLKVGYYIVSKIIKEAKAKGKQQINIERANALTTDNSLIRNFDSYRDAANIFPKKAGYKRATY